MSVDMVAGRFLVGYEEERGLKGRRGVGVGVV